MARGDGLLPVGYPIDQAIARFEIGIDQPKAPTTKRRAGCKARDGSPFGRQSRNVAARPRRSPRLWFPLLTSLLPHQRNTKKRHQRQNANTAIRVATRPASPNVGIRPDSENCRAIRKAQRLRASEACRPDDKHDVAKCVKFILALQQPVAGCACQLHAVRTGWRSELRRDVECIVEQSARSTALRISSCTTGTPDKRVVDCCLYLAFNVAQAATCNDIRG
jgi:hypothetical protein